MTKVSKFKIIKPIDCDWKIFGNILKDIQYDTRQILNKSIQYCWEWQGFSSDYKKKFDEYPKINEFLLKKDERSGYSSLFGYIYDRMKNDFYKLCKYNYSTTINKAILKWKNNLKDILKGEKSILSFRSNMPIDMHDKCIKLIEENGKYYFILSLITPKFKKELGLDFTQFKILINIGDNNKKIILNRCINKNYKISASQIINNDKEWFINLSYTFIEEKKSEFKNILGIDMGIVYPVYMAVHNTLIRNNIEGGEIERFRKQIEKRKKQLQHQGKYCGNGRIGHGVITRIKPLEQIKNKISNFRDTTNHKYARYVVDFAIKYECGLIQMEDLSGIAKDDVFLKKWSYYDLQQKIEYKAKEAGINVVYIKAKYTSQRCSKCGHIDKENRKEQSKFCCVKCGFEANADYNAALNIANPQIENEIKEKKTAK